MKYIEPILFVFFYVKMCTEYPVEMLIDPVDNLVYHTALLINKRVISYGRSGCQIVNEEVSAYINDYFAYKNTIK